MPDVFLGNSFIRDVLLLIMIVLFEIINKFPIVQGIAIKCEQL